MDDAVSANGFVSLTLKLVVTICPVWMQLRLLLMQLPKPLKTVGVEPVAKANVTGCPVALSVMVNDEVCTAVTVPVTLLTSTRLPSEPAVVLADTDTSGVIVNVLVTPAVASTKEPATLRSTLMSTGWPATSITGLANGTFKEMAVSAGESSHTAGVAPAVQECAGVAVSVAVVPGSTFTAAVAVPKVSRIAV